MSGCDPDELSGLCKIQHLTTCKTYGPGERGEMYVACLRQINKHIAAPFKSHNPICFLGRA